MRTYEEIKAANPNFGKIPVPLFENTDEPAMSQDLSNRQSFQETLEYFAEILPDFPGNDITAKAKGEP